jgi:cytochrome c oxidase subunit 3
MTGETNISPTLGPRQPLSMHPMKFALWLFIISIVMLFAALTSAYIVKQSDGGWMSIRMPGIFIVNTVILAISSITMQWSYLAAKKDKLAQVKASLLLTLLLGIGFLAGQYMSWAKLVEMNVYFVSNHASSSFIYVFTGLHAVHLVSGLVFLLATLIAAYRFKVHSKRLVKIEMCTTYWHFLGGLWLYLYLFLLVNP